MKKQIALLRGINVGGRNKLPMKELKAELAKLGLQNVQTYIQSGNVVFESSNEDIETIATQIGAAIEQSHGFLPKVMVIDEAGWQTAVSQNPFPQATAEPKTLHLCFLQSPPNNPNFDELNTLKKENEQFELIGSVFYLHAPDGIGRSKLAERVERLLGVPATARNWRTVSKITDMLES